MTEPLLFGVPLSQMFLYFVWYALLGWVMESCFCSCRQHRWINRGFLHLPLCPIYGVGVLIMVNFFTPFVGNPPLFYVMATLVMSAWEYFVGWLLETTTHMKYWDYSNRKFNLKGRVCLGNCLFWGVAAYFAIFWIHPATVRFFAVLNTTARQVIASILALAVLADTAVTIRQLALLRRTMLLAEQLRIQLESNRKELRDMMNARRADLKHTLDEKRLELQFRLEKLEAREHAMLGEALRRSKRFRLHYTVSMPRHPRLFNAMKRRFRQMQKEEKKP